MMIVIHTPKMKAVLAASAAPYGVGHHRGSDRTPPARWCESTCMSTLLWRQRKREMTSLILPSADSAMMTLFLEHVSQTFSKYFIIMQVDGASWHHSDELVIPSNIRLITQPAYSPEVNPVEHIWDDVREKHFGNRAFPSLDALIEVLCQGLNELADDPERLRSLTGFPHLVNVNL
jgi:hypothetical protein